MTEEQVYVLTERRLNGPMQINGIFKDAETAKAQVSLHECAYMADASVNGPAGDTEPFVIRWLMYSNGWIHWTLTPPCPHKAERMYIIQRFQVH